MVVPNIRVNLFVNKYKSFLFYCFFVVFVFVVLTSSAFARSVQYAPGETLNPDCSPGEANCAVAQFTVNTTLNNFGLGTTSPYAKLSVVGEIVSAYFTATTSTASHFPYASSTAFTASGTGFFGNLLATGSTTLQNFTFLNATGTSATTTNFFATTASSTNLFASIGNLNTLTVASTFSAGTTTSTNLVVTNTSTSTFAGFIDVNGTGTNATSTFASNLWVKGGFRVGTGTTYLNGSATSTFSAGINLASGCFSVAGVCISGGGGGGSGTVGLGTAGQVPFYESDGTTLVASSTLFISSGGNVGIGQASAASRLSISNNLSTYNESIDAFTKYQILLYNSTDPLTSSGIGIEGDVFDSENAMWFNSGVNGVGTPTFKFKGNGATQIATLNGANHVLYGTVAAGQSNLLLYNSASFEDGANSARLSLAPTGSYTKTTAPYVESINEGSVSNLAGLEFGTYNGSLIERMRITASGNVGIGTTTPGQKLSVAGDILGNNIIGSYFTATSTTATSSFSGNVVFSGLDLNPGGTGSVCIDANSKEIYKETSGGTCTVSSARFKNNIKSLDSTSGLSLLNRLRPVSFNLNVNDTAHLGFIAEEVAVLEPRLTFNEKDGVTVRGVRYEELTAVLAKAIQEQQVQIEGLKMKTFTATVVDTLQGFGITISETFAKFKDIFVKTLHIEDKLCVDDVCIGKEELKTLLRNAGGVTTSVQPQIPTSRGSLVEPIIPEGNATSTSTSTETATSSISESSNTQDETTSAIEMSGVATTTENTQGTAVSEPVLESVVPSPTEPATELADQTTAE